MRIFHFISTPFFGYYNIIKMYMSAIKIKYLYNKTTGTENLVENEPGWVNHGGGEFG